MTHSDEPLDTRRDEEQTLAVATSPSSPPRARPIPRAGYRKAGRPPKALTEVRLSLILEQVALGVPPQTAAVASGVPERTWKNWLAAGRLEDAVEPYLSMVQRVEAAIAFFQHSQVRVINLAAERDARHAEWLLERRAPEEWADRTKGGVTVNVGVIVESPEWRALSARLLEVLAPFPDALDAVLVELGGGTVVDGEAVELSELAA